MLESESELLYESRFTANQFVLATSLLRPMTRMFIFQLNTCGNSSYVTWSLRRKRVCCLQLVLDVASAATFGLESRKTRDRISLPQCRDSPNLEDQAFVFICPKLWIRFRLLVRLAGRRWRYSTPRAHGNYCI
jgi:hypothetical protein